MNFIKYYLVVIIFPATMSVSLAQAPGGSDHAPSSQQWFRFCRYNETENGSRQAPASLAHLGTAKVASGTSDPVQSISKTGFWDWEKEAKRLAGMVVMLTDIRITVAIPDLTNTGVAPEDLRLIGWDGNSWNCLGSTGASGTTEGSTLSGMLSTEDIKIIGIGSISNGLPIATDRPASSIVFAQKKKEEQLFRAYPNPTTGTVYLTLEENKASAVNMVKGIESITVVNMNGRPVTADIKGGNNTYVVNFPMVPNGTYLIIITKTDRTTETHRVVYQK
jgi:hypothetical protein